ncbi:MAG: PHB depolymerase family esterase [Alphaproteobacteria bacterium]
MARTLAFAATLGLAAGATVSKAGLADSLIVNGVEREYLITIPPAASLPAPAVVLLHGGGGSARQLHDHIGFDALAAAQGVVAIYPDAASLQWADGRISANANDQRAAQADDVGFLLALVDMLTKSGVIDPTRVGVAGISNGGMMTLRLACEAPRRFAVYAVVAANVPRGLECPGGVPVPILFIHGTQDPLIPYAGGDIAPQLGGSHGTALPVPDTMAIWAARNGCAAGPTTLAVIDRLPNDGTAAQFSEYTGCRAALGHILIEGMGHSWPGTRDGFLGGPTSYEIDGNRAIWDFMAAQFPR